MADEVIDQPESTGGLGVIQGKPVAPPKGSKFNLPVTPSVGVMPSSVLEDMERLYAEKVASRNPFAEWMKDIAAWGGSEKPGTTGETLRKRAEEKSGQDAELFNMRAQIAAARAQQAQQAQIGQYLQGLVGGRGDQAAPGAPGAAPGAGGLPPHVAVAVREKLGLGDVAGAQKVIDDYRKGVITEENKFVTNPASYQNNIPVVLPDGRIEEVNAIVARHMFENGQAAPATPGMTRTPAAAPTPAPVAAPTPAPAAAPMPTPVTAETDGFMLQDMSPQQREALALGMQKSGLNPRDIFEPGKEGMPSVFNRYPLDVRQRAFKEADNILASGAIPQPSAPAQAPQPAAPAPVQRPTIPEARARMAEEAKEREGMAATQAKQFESFLTSIDPPVAVDRAETAREIIDLTTNNSKVVGILQSPGVGPAIATLLQSGVSISGGHSVGMKEVDEAIFRARPGTRPEDIAARERLRTLLEKTAFHLSNIIKGQGQVTEFERVLLQQVAGSVRTTPENIVKIQKSLLARAELDQKVGEMFNRRPEGMTFSKFKATEEYRNAVKAYEDRLREIQKEKVSFPKAAPAGAPKSGTAPGGVKWKVLP